MCSHIHHYNNTGNWRKPSETSTAGTDGPDNISNERLEMSPACIHTGSPTQAVWPYLVISSMLTKECQNRNRRGKKERNQQPFSLGGEHSKKCSGRPSWPTVFRKFGNVCLRCPCLSLPKQATSQGRYWDNVNLLKPHLTPIVLIFLVNVFWT
jgi:hypothetical protein